MNRSESNLHQLFKAAREVSVDAPETIPEPLKRRILTEWRSGLEGDDVRQNLLLMFHRALICAGLVMALSVIWAFGELIRTPQSHVAVANYELRADLMP